MTEKRRGTPPAVQGMGRQRDSGVLLHITSLPGPHGIGDLGPEAYAWIDALREARQSWWQFLPLGPTGEGNSPYTALSAFAGNPNLISPDLLVHDGLIRRGDLQAPRSPASRVDYPRITRFKTRLVCMAWQRFRADARRRPAFERFCQENAAWLDDFSLFMAVKEASGERFWTEWPRDLAFRDAASLRQTREDLADLVERHSFAQFLFHRQWSALRRYAHQQGIRLIGDLPIFVSHESADAWAHPHLFQLDRQRRPTAVAGVPPDFFSKTGQRWGNPLYNWKAMREEAYVWWIARFRAILSQVDVVRIDHFRGFEAYWSVPARARTAQRGRWVKAPGMELFQAARKALGGLPFIAEDLGVITPEVEALRDRLGLPGMRVLQFGFGGDADSIHLPHNYGRNCVAYTGTHDNDTTVGWFRSLQSKARQHFRRYLPEGEDDVAWSLLRLAWSSVADHVIVPAQDLLGLGSAARMNVPGRAEGNWQWRLEEGQLTAHTLDHLAGLTAIYGRTRAGRNS